MLKVSVQGKKLPIGLPLTAPQCEKCWGCVYKEKTFPDNEFSTYSCKRRQWSQPTVWGFDFGSLYCRFIDEKELSKRPLDDSERNAVWDEIFEEEKRLRDMAKEAYKHRHDKDIVAGKAQLELHKLVGKFQKGLITRQDLSNQSLDLIIIGFRE